MHFIHSNWFGTNWLWILLFFIGSIIVIAYINNKKQLYKNAIISFISVFVFTIGVAFYSPDFININNNNISIGNIAEKATSPTVFTNILGYIVDIFIKGINK